MESHSPTKHDIAFVVEPDAATNNGISSVVLPATSCAPTAPRADAKAQEPQIHMEKGRFTQAQLAKLAQKKDTVVYHHKFDAPEAIMPAADQMRLFKAIVAGFDAGCRINKTASDEALREKVLRRSPEVRLFQRLFSKIFASVTQRARTPADERRIDALRKLVMHGLMVRVSGDEPEEMQAARVAQIAMRMAMRPATEKELKDVDASIVNPDDPKTDPKVAQAIREMTPLDPSAYGESTVRQR
jgi:hypothetical protein